MVEVRADGEGVVFAVKVVPGASRTRVAGRWGNLAKITVAAPAEKGKANEALTAYLADLLGVRKRDVSITAGHNKPQKTIRVEGIRSAMVRAALQTALR